MTKIKVINTTENVFSYAGETINPGENEIDAAIWASYALLPHTRKRMREEILIADAVPIDAVVPEPEPASPSKKKKKRRGRNEIDPADVENADDETETRSSWDTGE